MNSIYEIDKKIESLVDPETGEILDLDAFMNLSMERDKKIENMALWTRQLDANNTAIDAEINRLRDLKAANDRKATSLKQYLQTVTGGEKFSGELVQVSFRRSQQVTIMDDSKFLAEAGREYIREKIEREPDKTAIKEAIKSGVLVPGAALTENISTIIK